MPQTPRQCWALGHRDKQNRLDEMMKKNAAVFSFFMLVCGLALADDGGLLRCRALTEAAARLACYDALPLPQVAAKSTPAAPVIAPQTPAQFGLESKAAKTELGAIESRIVGRFEGWSAGSRIKFENGQVWQVSDDSSRYLDLNNPKIVVRRGALGAFYLEIDGTNHSPKVKRLQ
jgi:hypothetical protein